MLVTCPECKRAGVSDKGACPGCGYNFINARKEEDRVCMHEWRSTIYSTRCIKCGYILMENNYH